ncbi:MAG: magnesium transporter [Clostridia bacterium]|nr:magnesium transporter [Clostridia bacterium]
MEVQEMLPEDSCGIDAEEVSAMMAEKKYSAVRELLLSHPAVDISECFDRLDENLHPLLFRLLPKETAAEVFVEMDADHQENLISGFSDRELGEVLDELYLDDTVDMVEEMPANVVARILKAASPEMRKGINELLKYPDDSAGSIMTTEFVALKGYMTVDEAFRAVRRVAIDKETVYTCYVTDENRRLIGIISAKTLLISSSEAILSDIMEQNVISVFTTTDRENVAQMFDRYDFLALPVVDTENRLVGIITVDDAIDVMHQEVEEDFAKMAAITPTEEPYIKTSPWNIFKNRIPWLLLLMISATFTGIIISSFEDALATCVVLTAFIPMLMDTGGNSGSQASVTVIRGLSLGEIEFPDVFRVLFKELRVSFLCGVTLSAVAFGKVLLIDRLLLNNPDVTVLVALIVSLTLMVTVLCAKLIGCTLPILAKKLGFDPAVMASPFITTIVDAVSLLVYFSIARMFLGF